MDISGMKEAVQVLYEAQSRKTVGTASGKTGAVFADYMQEAVKGAGEVFPEGEDVVMNHPPLYTTKYGVDMGKPKEEMTLDEYKQYICNVVSGLPVSTSRKASSSGMLIFKEEAFESMKGNPEYEKTVLDMLRGKYSEEVSPYAPDVSYQVIGASEEECYGSAIPVKTYGMLLARMGTFGLGLNSSLFGPSGANASLLGMGSAALGLSGPGSLNVGLAGSATAHGTSYAKMVNAYKKTTADRNGNTSIREYKSRWREKHECGRFEGK